VIVIATYNIKGGVGKTATAINLAYLAAREGAPTLVWDLDPQGATSYYFRIKPRIKGSVKRLVQGNRDLFLERAKKPAQQLRKLLSPFKSEYYYVFLDCPPSISLASESVFGAADAILLPTIPTTLSLRTCQQVLKFFRQRSLDSVKVLPFFSMVDVRKQLHRTIVSNPPGYMTDVLPTTIPYSSDVERMGLYRAPLAEYAPRGRSAHCYEALWEDIKEKLRS
jgi:chromosome partitioning protein